MKAPYDYRVEKSGYQHRNTLSYTYIYKKERPKIETMTNQLLWLVIV